MRKKLKGGQWWKRSRMRWYHKNAFNNIKKTLKANRNESQDKHPGETEVYRITPTPGECYKYALATRRVFIGGGEAKYFTSKEPKYAGKYVKTIRYGPAGNGQMASYVFIDKNGREVEIELDYDGKMCFLKTECENNENNS